MLAGRSVCAIVFLTLVGLCDAFGSFKPTGCADFETGLKAQFNDQTLTCAQAKQDGACSPTSNYFFTARSFCAQTCGVCPKVTTAPTPQPVHVSQSGTSPRSSISKFTKLASEFASDACLAKWHIDSIIETKFVPMATAWALRCAAAAGYLRVSRALHTSSSTIGPASSPILMWLAATDMLPNIPKVNALPHAENTTRRQMRGGCPANQVTFPLIPTVV